MHAAAVLRARGEFVYSPIAHSHEMSEYYAAVGLPASDSNWWADENEVMLDRCDGMYVLMLPCWEESKGVSREISYALNRGLEVQYLSPTTYMVAGVARGSPPVLAMDCAKPGTDKAVDLATVNPGGFLTANGF